MDYLDIVKNSYQEFLRKLRLFWNRQHRWIQIRRRGRFFTIVIHERFRKYIKLFKYIIAVVGIASGLIVFANVLYPLLFGAVLFLVQTIIEKIIFSYDVLVIMPLPNFTLEGNKWLGVVSGYAEDLNGSILLLGMIFSDEEYARKLYEYLLSWNYWEHIDRDNNIIISIVTNESVNKYVLYIYANPDRQTAKQAFYEIENERRTKAETFTDVLIKNYLMLALGKTCIVSKNSFLPILLKTYKDGKSYYFGFYYTKMKMPDGGPVNRIAGTKDIIKFNLKIKKESELIRGDIEYDMRRNWNQPNSEFLGPEHLINEI